MIAIEFRPNRHSCLRSHIENIYINGVYVGRVLHAAKVGRYYVECFSAKHGWFLEMMSGKMFDGLFDLHKEAEGMIEQINNS